MAWRYDSADNRTEVIVTPNFCGNLTSLASSRPVWIVDSPYNRPSIDTVWVIGADLGLFEVCRYSYDAHAGDNRMEDLLEIMGCLDDHHPHHDLVVHGIEPAELGTVLEEHGYRLQEITQDGFVAVQIPEIRDRLIGWA
jgi:hypothetical protein